MKTFADSVVLITGASSGFGAEFARQLAPVAKTLILAARRTERLESLRDELARPGLTIQLYTVDLADAAATAAFLQELARGDQRVTLLINNAGLGDHGLFEDCDWPKVEQMLLVNVVALTRLTRALLPELMAARGAVLNVSSVASLLPLPTLGVYAATKAYVTSFSEALRAELRGTGVSVTALCPGPVTTEFFDVAQRAGNTDAAPAPAILKVSAQLVVATALKAVLHDRARVIPGWLTSVAMTLASCVPMFLMRLGMSPPRKKK
ncbi:SDR family NAD(P)-dependent oxidoreductase [Anatilimnocola floriformis]|uniref:SDR family NAD(P)-dependent oxidoreductase n=1 Tax=Anatilimnocola floriformis TaxID=2948575 RepID=UPI0020C2B646|nr:SDR family oxidoreductase [Anatilimnocola floriformis]